MYIQPSERLFHKGLIGSNGETAIACTEPIREIDTQAEFVVMSEWLHDEITCPDCRRLYDVPNEPSRGGLLRNNLNVRLNIIFNFIDSKYWNDKVRRPGEEKINPDPDGELAHMFLDCTASFEDLMKPGIEAMKKHEKVFGWANLLEEPKSSNG